GAVPIQGSPPTESSGASAQPVSAAPAPSGSDVDSPGPTELVVRWLGVPYDTSVRTDARLDAEVENVTPKAQRAKLMLEAGGLDGRTVRREISELVVPGRSKAVVAFTPADFPLQSERATAWVVAQLEYTSDDGAQRVVPAKPV